MKGVWRGCGGEGQLDISRTARLTEEIRELIDQRLGRNRTGSNRLHHLIGIDAAGELGHELIGRDMVLREHLIEGGFAEFAIGALEGGDGKNLFAQRIRRGGNAEAIDFARHGGAVNRLAHRLTGKIRRSVADGALPPDWAA